METVHLSVQLSMANSSSSVLAAALELRHPVFPSPCHKLVLGVPFFSLQAGSLKDCMSVIDAG